MAPIPSILAIVPFFGGTSSATHSLEETRIDYLTQTYSSLDALGFDVRIFQSRRDRVEVEEAERLDVDPVWLPYAACKAVQGEDWGAYDLVYYTEADQVLRVHDEDVYGIPDDECYLAPWRLDAIGPQGEREMEGGATISIGGVSYGVSNGGHRIPAEGSEEDKWGVIDFHAQQQAFAGAWLATRDYFLRIPFRKMRNLPVEHASGFDAKSVGECVRTAWVERCWIEHLSPRDRWAQESSETSDAAA